MMRRTKPLAAVAVASLLTLAACGGGGGSSDSTSDEPGDQFTETGAGSKDAEAQGPAPQIDGSSEGGTITVYLPQDPGPSDLDPTGGWSVTGNSIQQALVNRSLTQFMRNEEGDAVLVPDLATDLGTPNEDFTEWTFTIKEGVMWETGDEVTPEEVAFGIIRSLDAKEFPSGPGTEYSKPYFLNGESYKGPYTDEGKDYDGVTFDNDARTVTIKMAKPFPDMDYWGSFMAMGPIPTGKISDPPGYGKDPLSTGPYKVESFRPEAELTLVRNDQWDPATDPARHQYADSFVFKFNADLAQSDEIMLSGNTESQTAVTAQVGASNYAEAKEVLGDRLVLQGAQCVSTLTPDYTKITEIGVRKALAYAYPYEDAWLAGGELPGVTRVPANSLMPPGMAGKQEDVFPDGEEITFQPEKSLELLKEAGYEPGEYEIRMIYSEEPTARERHKQVQKGFEDGGFKVTAIPQPATKSLYDFWLDPDNKTNQSLNLRGVNWCSDWPSASTMIPPLAGTGATYNTANFSEPAVDDRIQEILTLPLEEQPDAWGELDSMIMKDYFPIVPTDYRNDLYGFGERIGSPAGLASIGAPYYQNLYVIP